ncbi:MAG TPA: lysylphosphatidylglycerol synthase transmembrane domain-containing protein [Chitinophagaceae bacterium]|nr:lysylphosphatidylglycerol synthase transmembrane domain-containing protein [Chitinophagaceae bacterium]
MNKKTRTIIQYIFFFALGLLFVWLSLKNLNKENIAQIKKSFYGAKYWLILPVFGLLILSHIIRAYRWKLLIEPLGYKVSTLNAFFAVMIGYLVNQGVPRLGEVIKCSMLNRYEKVPLDTLIGTVIVERLVDGLSFLTVLGITFALQPGLYSQLVDSLFSKPGETNVDTLPGYIILLGFLLIIAVATAAWMILKRKTFKDLLLLLKKIGLHIWQGITSVKHLRRRGLFIVLSVLLWTIYLISGYIGFFAFAETAHYGMKEAFTVLSAGTFGMLAAPGGIGAYAFLVEKAMMVYGLNAGVALAFGWILWIVTFAVIVMGGLISFVVMPYYNKHRKIEESRIDTAENTFS